MQGTLQDGMVTFNSDDSEGDDQKVLNIFYFNNVMHDYFYLLGFREENGNFQNDNFGRGGVPSDRVDARAYSGAVWGTANMYTPVDGSNPVMKMGLVESSQRHTVFDSSVVFHEYTHGVTNRLVGGPMDVRSLEAIQSSGMGGGWSDYFPCTINNTTVVGDWIAKKAQGIRAFPYDSNFPDNFGNLGTGRYTGVNQQGKHWPHPIGEIWCATLMEMNRNIGANLGVQLVFDALKLSPSNPSFLDMRDAIFAALDAILAGGKLRSNQHSEVRRSIWEAFAKFGMGPNARSNGASLSGIVTDFVPPTGIELISPGVPVSSTISEENGTQEYVLKCIESGRKITLLLQGPEGQDFDLYVKYGERATTTYCDFKETSSSPNEEITIDSTREVDYYILVSSYRGSGSFTLNAQYENDIKTLILDEPASSTIPEEKGIEEYVLKRIESGRKITILLRGPEDQDFDLFVKFGDRAKIHDYDYKSNRLTANEEIIIDSTQQGDYYLMVYASGGSGPFCIEASTKPGNINVLYPNGGEVWEKGKTYNIRWESQSVGNNVKIMLESETGGQIMISDSAPNIGNFQYTVPYTLANEQYKVMVVSLNNSIQDVSDEVFSITGICAVPVYDPHKWNDNPNIKWHNNCYNYACDRILYYLMP